MARHEVKERPYR
uniref:Uncharacterized protein n=1 Tax=Arundo donax TaxID=35708 RepID=A0A0A8Y8M7_ARUDO